ncbi:hypothetical protein D9M69_586330 [compost metagenome]
MFAGLDQAVGLDREHAVCCLQRKEGALVAEHIGGLAARSRHRVDAQLVFEHTLMRRAQRAQVHHVLREVDRAVVAVARAVQDA